MEIWIGIKDHKWADDKEYTLDEAKNVPSGMYDYLMLLYGYNSAKEWKEDQQKKEKQRQEKEAWCQKFIEYMNSDNHCPFCELLIPNKPDEMHRDYTCFELDEYHGHVNLCVEKDETGRIYLYGSGEEYSERYYPRYCPHCGRKL